MTEEKKSKAVNIFAILGFALLLLVAVWSTIQVVKFVPKMFADNGVNLPSLSTKSSSNEIEINLEKLDAVSGDPLDIKWNFDKPSDGIMSFSYECKSGLHFRIDDTVLPCNAAHTIADDSSNSMIVTPVSDSNRYIDVSFAITFTDTEGESMRDVESITITNDNVSGSPDTISTDNSSSSSADTTTENKDLFGKTDTNQQVAAAATPVTTEVQKDVVRYVTIPATPYSNPNGVADLQLRIISMGALNPYTGVFVPKGTVHVSERAAVKFEVKNLGDKATGAWTYSAELPTIPHYIYESNVQQSLMPGSTATVVVAFDKLARGYNGVSIHVDSYNAIYERNEMNNRDARNFSVVSY